MPETEVDSLVDMIGCESEIRSDAKINVRTNEDLFSNGRISSAMAWNQEPALERHCRDNFHIKKRIQSSFIFSSNMSLTKKGLDAADYEKAFCTILVSS